nr:MAG TPA: hypothetical protein [Caudoviricetes sp.]DAR91703.1 MAG TPA: hypothetical protein [Caudoviricetes sp.]
MLICIEEDFSPVLAKIARINIITINKMAKKKPAQTTGLQVLKIGVKKVCLCV